MNVLLSTRTHHEVGHVLDEAVVRVERGHASPVRDAVLLRELPVFHVDLLERLDVLGHEGHRHHNQVFYARRAQLLQRLLRVWPE